MKHVALAFTVLLFCTEVFAQPQISDGGVFNAASYIPNGLPASGIAQGSIFVLFGKNLGPAQLVSAPALPLKTDLSGTSVRVSVGGVTKNAFLLYTYAGQLSAVLPSDVPAGDGTIVVTYNGRASAPVSVHVVKSGFGIFTRNQAGIGPAIVQNYVSPTDVTLNTLLNSARPGQVEILWGTGLGAITADDSSAPPVGNLNVDVGVLVGGKPAKVMYKGRSSEFPGLDQVNFEVPDGLAGCHVPIAVRTGGVAGNYATISISPNGGTCSDPVTYTSADLKSAQQKGSMSLGVITLTKLGFYMPGQPPDLGYEGSTAKFTNRSLDALLASLGPWENGGKSVPLLSAPPGSCTVYQYTPNDETGDFTPLVQVRWTGLRAGANLNLTGPQGTKQVPPNWFEGYFKVTLGGNTPGQPLLPSYLLPGDYKIDNGSGGTDVGVFRAGMTLPPPFTWNNKEQLTDIRRDQDLTVTWTSSNPDNEIALIIGYSTVATPYARASFVCTERTAAGRFTVPVAVLSNLPVSSPFTGDSPTATLLVGAMPLPARFTAPGLDLASFMCMPGTMSIVSYK